ncbi:hypothetical protein DFH09DRAFT_1181024 [Mycena vulgaris]|nr:hypothetical protein DFH09DRAFT_1181024 [Mycena vulgaris]
MQIYPVVWALALSLVSAAAAQSSQTAPSPAYSSLSAAPTAWAITNASSQAQVGHVDTSINAPAAIGGSVAGFLVVLAGVLFFVHRRRARKTVLVNMDTKAETNRRCDDLENQVFELRAQLDRLEQFAHGTGARYTNTKEAEALGKGSDAEVKKGAPPTYAD